MSYSCDGTGEYTVLNILINRDAQILQHMDSVLNILFIYF